MERGGGRVFRGVRRLLLAAADLAGRKRVVQVRDEVGQGGALVVLHLDEARRVGGPFEGIRDHDADGLKEIIHVRFLE